MLSSLPTHYDTLGVMPSAEPEEVRQAYRKLAREYHPDINPDPKAHEAMAQINVAFEVLSDPVRRMEYDAVIGHSLASEPGRPTSAPTRVQAVYARVLHRHTVHGTPVYGVAYDQASGRLVSSSFDNELIWWSAGDEFAERRLKLDGGVVSTIQTGPRGVVVAAGSTEQTLACWKVGSGRPATWRQTPKEWICSLKPSPDAESLALGTVDNIVRVLSADTGATRWQLAAHDDSVTALAWSVDSQWLATGGADASIKIWCGTTGRELLKIDQIRSAVTALCFSPDGKWLAAAGVDLTVRVFGTEDGGLKQTFFGHEKPIEALAFHPRSWLLGSASRDGNIGLWNVRRGVDHGRIEASHQPISCLAFSPTGLRMASGGLDKVLRIWELSSTPEESRS